MTLFDEFTKQLTDNLEFGTYIVRIKYKYSHEKEFTEENQIFDFMPDECCWLDDWWEGQQEGAILGYCELQDVNKFNILLIKRS